MSYHRTRKAQAKYWVLALVSLVEDLVVILTLASIVPHWRGDVLFSEWMEED